MNGDRRRAMLHRQIAALEAQLILMGNPAMPWARRKFFKLLGKLKRLKAELIQPRLPL